MIARQPEYDAPPPEPHGADYKRPESILVVVFTSGGEFLLIRRTKPADFWQSITGSLETGESARTAAIREVWEETGLRANPQALYDLCWCERFPIHAAWRHRYRPGVHYNLEHWFALHLARRREVRLNPSEHADSRWLPVARATTMASSWTNRKAIRLVDSLFNRFGT